MPIYEYECEACGHRLEVIQKISDEPLRDCPECEEAGLRKLVSAAAFRLKGGGWYETDFKSGNKRNLAESSSGEEKKKSPDGKTGGKQQAKAASA
jgi:putative FmdB family regulatory protein